MSLRRRESGSRWNANPSTGSPEIPSLSPRSPRSRFLARERSLRQRHCNCIPDEKLAERLSDTGAGWLLGIYGGRQAERRSYAREWLLLIKERTALFEHPSRTIIPRPRIFPHSHANSGCLRTPAPPSTSRRSTRRSRIYAYSRGSRSTLNRPRAAFPPARTSSKIRPDTNSSYKRSSIRVRASVASRVHSRISYSTGGADFKAVANEYPLMRVYVLSTRLARFAPALPYALSRMKGGIPRIVGRSSLHAPAWAHLTFGKHLSASLTAQV